MDLQLDRLTVARGPAILVRSLSLDVARGEVVGLVGPNGSGKSTALRCVYRALKPTGGVVRVHGDDVTSLGLRRNAQVVAALTQEGGVEFDFTVGELVALGRAPHLPGNQALSARERELCVRAMEQMHVAHLADRGVLTLSGGERQRVLVARALVQEPEVLVLDEPTNHLDLHHQVELLRLLRDSPAAVLVVLHDLNLAAAVCDRIVVLRDGEQVASGPPAQVLTSELLRSVFGVEAVVVPHPETGAPQLLFSLNRSTDPESRTPC